jgi:hypothetical protein
MCIYIESLTEFQNLTIFKIIKCKDFYSLKFMCMIKIIDIYVKLISGNLSSKPFLEVLKFKYQIIYYKIIL